MLPLQYSFLFHSSHDYQMELIKDTEEMMDVILPLCHTRPNVYHHLSEKLSRWILEIEEIDDEATLENILMSVESKYSDIAVEGDRKSRYHVNPELTTAYSDTFTQSNTERTTGSSFSSCSNSSDDDYYSNKENNNFTPKIRSNSTNLLLTSPKPMGKRRCRARHFSDGCLYTKNNTALRSETFLSRGQVKFLSTATCNTIDHIKLDLIFLKHELQNVVKKHSRIRDTVRDLIRQLESDIAVWAAIRRNKDRGYEKEWNSERDLLLQILNDLEEKIFVARRNSSKSNFYQQIMSDNECHYPHANIYNQVLTQYLSHTRPLQSYDTGHYNNVVNSDDHSRWKRPERPTSQIRWNDVQVVDEILSKIPRDDEDNSKFAASYRVCMLLLNIRERCHEEAEAFTKVELELARQRRVELERRQEMRLFKKRNKRTRMSFAALPAEAKRRLLGQLD